MTNQTKVIDEAVRDMLSMALRRYKKDGTANFADYAYEVERLKQALATELVRMMEEALPEKRNTQVGDAYQRTFCSEYNKAIAETRTRLTAIIERELS